MVGTGVSGGLTTRGRPSQRGDSQFWAPKKDTCTESLESGDFQYEHSGVASTGARSSEVVTITDAFNDAAAHADPGVAGPISGTVVNFGASSLDLVGFTPPSSNSGCSSIEDHPKVPLGHGGLLPTSASSGKHGEREKKSDLHGTGSAGYGYEKGYYGQDEAHYGPPAAGSTEVTMASVVDGIEVVEGKEQSPKSKTGRGAEETRGSDLGGNKGVRQGEAPPVKSWKNLFSLPVKTSGPLQFYRPHSADGNLVARPPAETVNEGIDMWKGCLVGQFLDKRLLFPVVRSLVNRLWGKREMPDISTTENGLYFFRFRDPEARDWVMDSGPWRLAGRPFILRAWQPGMDMLNIQLSIIPIWVKFYNIPLEYWTSTCLGYIASTVGIPLYLD